MKILFNLISIIYIEFNKKIELKFDLKKCHVLCHVSCNNTKKRKRKEVILTIKIILFVYITFIYHKVIMPKILCASFR